ncbi:MAG: hypothetical protein HY300_05385, partial [Verrucomicrobia bacterium]|nr:hypothetical protein [Verrucomicrobiota bacterium]
EDDAQKAAADLMVNALTNAKVTITNVLVVEGTHEEVAKILAASLATNGSKMFHLIGPKTGHAYEPGAKKVVAKLVDDAANKRRDPWPKEVRLTTYSLKWNSMHWLTVDALDEHWKRAVVSAAITQTNGIVINEENVQRLTVAIADDYLPSQGVLTVVLDGTPFTMKLPAGKTNRVVVFQKTQLPGVEQRRWFVAGYERDAKDGPVLSKRHDLQGPIDDAFMDSFIMVRPTGRPMNEAAGKWAKAEMDEALSHWRRYFRGEPRVKDDSAITEDDIKNNNLILWGDPSSNKLLDEIGEKLPLKWTARGILVGERKFDATKHAPVFIYPNPLNPSRYVVINSGFTFPQFAAASNSLQTPKLPDWAILDLSVPLAERVGGKGVVDANFFDERWQLKTVAR